jgi:ferredoxin
MEPATKERQSEPREQRSFRVVLETPGGLRSLDCGPDEFVWDAAARNGVVLPAICHQGRCLTCAGRLLEGQVDQTASALYFPEDEAAHFILLCTATPLSDLRILTHQQDEMRAHRLEKHLPAPYS